METWGPGALVTLLDMLPISAFHDCVDDAVVQRGCKLEKERRLISACGLSARVLAAKIY